MEKINKDELLMGNMLELAMVEKLNEIIDWIQKEEARQNAKLPEGVTINRD